MTTATEVDADSYAGPRCPTCDGPCWLWKGSVWGYTCTACLTEYLDASAAKGAERDHRERARLLRKMSNEDRGSTPVASRRRDGAGPRYVPQHRPGVDR